jgi:hypothetical protein
MELTMQLTTQLVIFFANRSNQFKEENVAELHCCAGKMHFK